MPCADCRLLAGIGSFNGVSITSSSTYMRSRLNRVMQKVDKENGGASRMSKSNSTMHLEKSIFMECVGDNRSYDEASLQILESAMASKDIKTLSDLRRWLALSLTSEHVSATPISQLASDKTIHQKLSVCDFFVRAFALAGDIQSCLALKYEALLLRQLHSPTHPWLWVSHFEWLSLAIHSLDIGFSSIARTACENALLCFHKNTPAGCKTFTALRDLESIDQIKKLRDVAISSVASNTVQVQAIGYLRKNMIKNNKRKQPSSSAEGQCLVSTMFRNGMKRRHLRLLHERQSRQ